MVLTGREKATILLSLLGSELSSQILRTLPEDMADLIASGVDHLPNPSADVITAVLDEFASFLSLPSGSKPKPLQPASYFREDASYVEPEPARSQRSPYDILFYSQPRKVAMALTAERDSVAAYVLSFLPKVQATDVLAYMSDKKRDIELIMKGLKKTAISGLVKDDIASMLADRLERMQA